MIERAPNKHKQDIDVFILAIVLVFAILSVIMVSSASRINITGNSSYFFIRQILWFWVGFIGLFLILQTDYLEYCKRWKWLYSFGIGILVLVVLIGNVTNGAQSWLQIGPVKLEPAELMKIVMILVLAELLRDVSELASFKRMAVILLMILVPILLVILQPDLGTAMMMSAIATGMIWASGVPRKHLLAILSCVSMFLSSLCILYVTRKDLFFTFIQPYQWERLTMFLDPDVSVSGSGYQLYQSLLAIGSGRFWGEGMFRGIQTQGAWIPERHTDFIFSVIAEELGFVGAGFLLLSYLLLLIRMIKIGREARDPTGSLIVAGVISMFLAQIFENVGMTMSMMPITGITLPLMSYGGSSIISSMLAIGLVLNVGYRRRKIRF